jgi:hypothetical protein
MISVVPVFFERVGSSDQWKVLGVLNHYKEIYDNPPAPLSKDLIVTLESGKFPLTDYTDCFPYSKHRYVFQLADQKLVGILDGFTYNCMPVGFGTGGTPNVMVLIRTANQTDTSNENKETNQNSNNNNNSNNSTYSSLTEADFAL